MTKGQQARPANIFNIVAINQGKQALTMQEPVAEPLDTARVGELVGAGHLLVDARSPADFGTGHLPGAFSVWIGSPEFEQRVGWVLPPDPPLVLVVDDAEAAQRAVHNLGFVGLDTRVAGYLEGGTKAWAAAGKELASLPQITVEELHRRLPGGADGGDDGDRDTSRGRAMVSLDGGDDGDSDGGPPQVLDVREPAEWRAGHIEGAELMSHKQLGERLDELELDPGREVAVVCGSGVRSSTASSLLARNGYERLLNVTGGMDAWAAAGLPMVDEQGCSIGGPAE
jgi:hydroxyacylglutathione hydrolase